MLLSKKQLLQALKNQLISHNLNNEINVNEITIDSRESLANKAFIAIKGENNDGHNFLDQAFENNCEIAIIHDIEIFKKHRDKNLILVKNTFDSLYEIAKFSRQNATAKIIAITGSVGKTSVKEMLKTVFQTQGKTYATPGNFNNHYGLPLTLCNMAQDVDFAILEIGMNNPGEIAPLSKLAKPDIAIITNIGAAHIGNFKNEEEIALEKSQIFYGLAKNGFALVNRDNCHFDFLQKQAQKYITEKNILSFGKNPKSDYRLEIKESQNFISTKNKKIPFEIPSINQAAIFNSSIVIATLDLLANDFEKGVLSLKKIEPANGRGNLINLKIAEKSITIIDDSYNANVASMKSAIQYLHDFGKNRGAKRTVAILGDMFELGDLAKSSHQEILNFAQEKIDLVITAGKNFQKTLDKKGKNYLNSKEISLDLANIVKDGDLVLIKGSRGMRIEESIKI